MINAQTKVLVVDDFDLVRTMLRRLLGDLGINNIEDARDGEEALEKLRSAEAAGSPYGIVFLDWNMPKKNGYDVLKECRESKEFGKLPIVMVTAEGERKDVLKALTSGATDYIVKPCSAPILTAKLKSINDVLARKAG
ncbi:MAG: response regulator [Bdellovibrionales bacterium]|nr:response regulator [Bdellovibrionales bacterium]